MKKPEEQKAAPSKVVKNEDTRPCGCHIVTYADDTASITPCPPCGLMDAARALSGAAQAIAAVANRLRIEQNSAVVSAAARDVARGQR